jgi:predicted phosphoadenosine phosphosulfate sulfurtransferase
MSSSGKDSVVVMELAIMVAKELGKLPVKVAFVDQETEFQSTIDYFRSLRYRKDEVELYWFQIPLETCNSTSSEQDSCFLNAWEESKKDKWMREKEVDSIKTNDFLKTNKLLEVEDIMDLTGRYVFGEKSNYVQLIGMRGAESLKRYMLMHKNKPVYKNVLWASRCKRQDNSYHIYPIYDWELSDIWHAIAMFRWKYNTLYDKLFQKGIRPNEMRLSCIIHETGIKGLEYLKDIEPKTFERLTQRIGGINTYNLMHNQAYKITKLPVVFSSWLEYRDYLLEKLVSPDKQQMFRNAFKGHSTDKEYKDDIRTILLNGCRLVKQGNAQINKRLAEKKARLNRSK